MPSTWYSNARRVNVGAGCGAMKGGPPRTVHHTTEGGTVDGAISTYRQTHNYPTFTIDYAKDDVVQHLPVTTGATAVKNATGGVDTNREGVVCIQIEWVGTAAKPFTTDRNGHLIAAGPKVKAFFDFLRAWGIPDVWPMGAPKAYPGSYGLLNGDRSPTVWTTRAGHYGHSQVPENEHGDPGAILPDFVKQTAKPALKLAIKPTPTPAPTPTPTTPEDFMLVQFQDAAGHVAPEVYQLVGNELVHITGETFAAAGYSYTSVKRLPATSPLAKLPRR